MRKLGSTPPFRGPDGEVLSGSIAEIAYRRLCGFDQWVMIRGQSVANPSLIVLHGGPGLSETGLFRSFMRRWRRALRSSSTAMPRSSGLCSTWLEGP